MLSDVLRHPFPFLLPELTITSVHDTSIYVYSSSSSPTPRGKDLLAMLARDNLHST